MIKSEDFWDKLLQSEIQKNEYWKKKFLIIHVKYIWL